MNASITTIKEPDGDILYPKTKTEAVYDNSNNRLDQTLSSIQGDLGSKSSASAVAGNDAFSKINTLNSDLASIKIYPNARIYYGDTTSYTATENCYVVACASTSPVYIDDVAATLAGNTYCGFLKSGQKISFETSTRLSVWSLKA